MQGLARDCQRIASLEFLYLHSSSFLPQHSTFKLVDTTGFEPVSTGRPGCFNSAGPVDDWKRAPVTDPSSEPAPASSTAPVNRLSRLARYYPACRHVQSFLAVALPSVPARPLFGIVSSPWESRDPALLSPTHATQRLSWLLPEPCQLLFTHSLLI